MANKRMADRCTLASETRRDPKGRCDGQYSGVWDPRERGAFTTGHAGPPRSILTAVFSGPTIRCRLEGGMMGSRIRALVVVSMFVLVGATLAVRVVRAQDPAMFALEEQRTAMAKLDYMVGDWQGTGWIQRGARETFTGGERVQRKLDGLALLVEGDFAATDAPSKSVHKTLGVIYYDTKTHKYRFDTWLAAGSHGEHELELLDDGWRWELAYPGGTIRYTM